VEEDISLPLPEAAKSAALQSLPDTTSVSGTIQAYGNATDNLGDGTTAWSAYVNQTAASIIKVKQSHSFATGAGMVAILDTGVDFMNPVLRSSLIWGYDFIDNVPMGQAMPVDLSSSTDSILDQSTTSILDQSTTSILDSNSTIILDQSTTSILDQSTTSILDGTRPINDWGHGTMVAGLVHLVAPSAKILPVKVFNAHGGSSLSLIIQGIHYAVDSGARVINMSFSMTGYSQQLADAIDFANSRGVILVAAAGNEGQYMTVYPAGYASVIGVGATDNQNLRTSFSNFGPVVDLAAPGAGVITTYPGNRYAAGWGTSFSAPMVAGAAALLVQMDRDLNGQAALQAVDQADSLGEQQLGAGLLDLVLACASFH
jgi:subtilisin family serine protease